jgi:hypothetical protein
MDLSLMPIGVVRALENGDVSEEEFASLKSDQTSEEIVRVVYTGLLVLLKSALRLPQSSLKSEMFKTDLKEIRIPQEFISDLVKAVFGPKRQQLDEAALEQRVRLPAMQSFRWRVNVSISTSALNRVLEPSVLVEMTLSNGRIHTFEVPISKFHELRYNVTYVLKQMEDLEKRSILKIQD